MIHDRFITSLVSSCDPVNIGGFTSRACAVVFGLCGCNQIWGLHDTVKADARQFDAPIDAPFRCPETGTAPRFSPQLHQLISEDCFSYSNSPSANLAVARCNVGTNDRIFQGPVDGPLAAVPGMPQAMDPDFSVDSPRLSPEGDLLFVTTFDLNSIVDEYRVYRRNPDTSWTRDVDLPVPQFGSMSVPSRGPDRHFLFWGSAHDMSEWVESSSGTWTATRTQMYPSIVIRHAWLAPDGLRMIVAGNPIANQIILQLFYADRANIADPFGAPVIVTTVPPTADTFMTEDCSRIYFSGVQTIFYVQQQ